VAALLVETHFAAKEERTMDDAALGFRVKSGWATVVLLAGSGDDLRIVDRRVVQLADPEVEDSYQPYHVALDLPKAEGAKVIARLSKATERFTRRSIAYLIKDYRGRGYRLRGAGLVVGSEVDPATIKNDHIRAHAEEGKLFRTVLVSQLENHDLRPEIITEKSAFEKAAQSLGISEPRLREKVAELGKQVAGSWRSEEKVAALAAWVELHRRTRGSQSRRGRSGR
jgi:hypothetical protein